MQQSTSTITYNNHYNGVVKNNPTDADIEATEKLLPITVLNFNSQTPDNTVDCVTTTTPISMNSNEIKLPQLSTATSMSIKEEDDEEEQQQSVAKVTTPTNSSQQHPAEAHTSSTNIADSIVGENVLNGTLLPSNVDDDGGGEGHADKRPSIPSHASLTPKSSLGLPNEDALSASESEGASSGGGITTASGVRVSIIENPIDDCESSIIAAANTNPAATATKTTTTANSLSVNDMPEAKSRRKLSVQGMY